jgi:branched-chain amino acid transport system substrate-binding protein
MTQFRSFRGDHLMMPVKLKHALPTALAATLLLGACSSSGRPSSASTPSAAAARGIVLSSDKKPTGTPVVLAMANLQDNDLATFPEASAAAQAAVDYINSTGGLLGHPLKLKVCALLATPESSTGCANQFVSEDPAAVIGGAVDAPSLIVPTLDKSAIPWISGVPADPTELTSANSFGVSGGPAANMVAYSLYAKAHGLKSFTYLASDVPAAVAVADNLGKPAFAADHIAFHIVTEPFTAVDLTPYITQAEADHPGAIAVGTTVAACVSAVKAAQQLGVTVPLLINDNCETAAFFKGAGSAFTSKDLVTGPYGRRKGDPDTNLFNAAMAKFAPSSPTNGYAPPGFATVMDIAAAVKAAHPSHVDAATVLAAMKAAKGVPAFLSLGSTLQCGGSLVPKYPSLCAATAYFYRSNGTTITPVATYDSASQLGK